MKRVKAIATIAIFTALLASPINAYATPEAGDQLDLTEEEIAAAIENGLVDTSGAADLANADAAAANARGGHVYTTVAGATRFETSAAQALKSFSSAQTVVVTGGSAYADSIAASGLAGALKAPILLVPHSSMIGATRDALQRLNPSQIIILGGTDVVSDSMQQQLGAYAGNVIRLSGPTRFETQHAIYEYGVSQGLWTDDTAIVATAMGFADALSVSPVAYWKRAPIFFVNSAGVLPEDQLNAIKQSGKSKFLIIGGTAVVSPTTEQLLSALGSVKRLGGATRFETSRQINDYAVANYGFTWEGVAFASAWSPWDSLGGGTMQGNQHRLLSLLSNEGPKASVNVNVPGKPSSMVYLGGSAVFPNSFKAQVAFKMGYSITDIEGFRVYIDAGHGEQSNGPGAGFDPGAIGSGYREVDLARQLADKVAANLRNTYGLNVYVNKSGYYKLRQTQASQLDCGVLISIHFNANGGRGTESFIHSVNAPTGSDVLQRSVHNELVSALGLPNRGMKRERFAVVSGKVPATLLEVAFIDNRSDINTYLGKIDATAAGIARGIANA